MYNADTAVAVTFGPCLFPLNVTPMTVNKEEGSSDGARNTSSRRVSALSRVDNPSAEPLLLAKLQISPSCQTKHSGLDYMYTRVLCLMSVSVLNPVCHAQPRIESRASALPLKNHACAARVWHRTTTTTAVTLLSLLFMCASGCSSHYNRGVLVLLPSHSKRLKSFTSYVRVPISYQALSGIVYTSQCQSTKVVSSNLVHS